VKLLTVQFPALTYIFTLHLLSPNILLRTLFSDTLSLYSSLNGRDQVYTHTNNWRKILHILNFTFLDSKREDKNL
jgi:hypothetical protein